jgi:hypothetical protein
VPASRKRRSTANAAARRQLARRRAHASIRRMVDAAEAHAIRRAREAGHHFCGCGGRLKPVKHMQRVIANLLRCNRCGRDTMVLPAPPADAAATPTRPETTEDPGIPSPEIPVPDSPSLVETGEVGTDVAISPHQNI